MYRQMGNSVAVPVIKELAHWMIEDLKILNSI
jgi:site-specific DNA-cytosine methylase